MPTQLSSSDGSSSPEKSRARSELLPLAALVVAFAGLFAAGVLSAGHLLKLPVPCGRSRGCLAVALDPASKVFGIPISFFGVAVYLQIIVLLRRLPHGRWARTGLVLLTALGTMASAGLLIYSHTVIRAACAWCIASGVAMFLLLILTVAMVIARRPLPAPKAVWVWTLGLVTCAALGVQAGLMQQASLRPPVPVDHLAGFSIAEFTDPAKSLGPSNALVTIVVFADLWCPACRAVHASLVQYQQAHPAAVQLIFRHLPLWEIRGHESSRAAAALSEMAAEGGKFWPFVEAVHSSARPLDRTGYLDLMSRLNFNSTNVEARLNDPQDPAVARVLRDEELAGRVGIHQTPTFILFVAGQQPISANQRTLPRLLNSPVVLSKLAQAAPP